MEIRSGTGSPPVRPSSVPLLVLKAFAIAIALVVSVSFATSVIMDLMGYGPS